MLQLQHSVAYTHSECPHTQMQQIDYQSTDSHTSLSCSISAINCCKVASYFALMFCCRQPSWSRSKRSSNSSIFTLEFTLSNHAFMKAFNWSYKSAH